MIVKNLSIFYPIILVYYLIHFDDVCSHSTVFQSWEPHFFSLTSYVRLDIELTIFVALLWVFSRIIASFLYIGDHTVVKYSKWGLTKDLKRAKNISLSK